MCSDPASKANLPVSSSRANVLVVAFHFPPLAAAGTHRTLNFVRELAERGHRIGVVTTGCYDGFAVDRGLERRLPRSVEVARTWHLDPFRLLGKLRGSGGGSGAANGSANGSTAVCGPLDRALDFVSRLCDVPDRYASWIPLALGRAIVLCRQIGADVVYTTAPPFSTHLVGRALKAVLRLPWIADFRDPWATNPFRENPFPSLRRADRGLEETVIRSADRVILNTRLAERGYRERYPDLDHFATITNGIDPDLLSRPARAVERNGSIHLLHVGTIYGRRSVNGLLHALARLKSRSSDLFGRLCIDQLGTVENQGELERTADSLGVAGRVKLFAPVPHDEAFARTQGADGLLLLGVSGASPEVQVPAKLFEYLAAGRPILALAKPFGAIRDLLESSGAPHECADPDDPDAIARALERFAASGRAGGADAIGGGVSALRYDRLAERLEREIAALVLPPRGPGSA